MVIEQRWGGGRGEGVGGVTECICTLCLFCCTLYVTLSTSLAFPSFMCGRHVIA